MSLNYFSFLEHCEHWKQEPEPKSSGNSYGAESNRQGSENNRQINSESNRQESESNKQESESIKLESETNKLESEKEKNIQVKQPHSDQVCESEEVDKTSSGDDELSCEHSHATAVLPSKNLKAPQSLLEPRYLVGVPETNMLSPCLDEELQQQIHFSTIQAQVSGYSFCSSIFFLHSEIKVFFF